MAKYEHIVLQGLELKPGEPWFLIRGQDKTAVAAIYSYAEILAGYRGFDDPAVISCFEFAARLEAWQKANPGLTKWPD